MYFKTAGAWDAWKEAERTLEEAYVYQARERGFLGGLVWKLVVTAWERKVAKLEKRFWRLVVLGLPD